jgi:hypothetical protein
VTAAALSMACSMSSSVLRVIILLHSPGWECTTKGFSRVSSANLRWLIDQGRKLRLDEPKARMQYAKHGGGTLNRRSPRRCVPGLLPLMPRRLVMLREAITTA